jgi:cbb3-type cytochrome oxidase maturation protein
MNVLLILIPVSIILGGLGLCGFLWTLRSGQYDDAEGSAARLLLGDDEPDKD